MRRFALWHRSCIGNGVQLAQVAPELFAALTAALTAPAPGSAPVPAMEGMEVPAFGEVFSEVLADVESAEDELSTEEEEEFPDIEDPEVQTSPVSFVPVTPQSLPAMAPVTWYFGFTPALETEQQDAVEEFAVTEVQPDSAVPAPTPTPTPPSVPVPQVPVAVEKQVQATETSLPAAPLLAAVEAETPEAPVEAPVTVEAIAEREVEIVAPKQPVEVRAFRVESPEEIEEPEQATTEPVMPPVRTAHEVETPEPVHRQVISKPAPAPTAQTPKPSQTEPQPEISREHTPVQRETHATKPEAMPQARRHEEDQPVPAAQHVAFSGKVEPVAVAHQSGTQSQTAPPAEQPRTTETPQPVRVPEEALETPATPLRSLTVSVEPPGTAERTDIHFVHRNGVVDLAVRATNPETARILRNDLPELVRNLEQQGFQSELDPGEQNPDGRSRRHYERTDDDD